MDLRLRILRRIIEIGSCKTYDIQAIFDYSAAFDKPKIKINVFSQNPDYTKVEDIKLVEQFDKIGLDEEKDIFEFLNKWAVIFEEERKYGTH